MKENIAKLLSIVMIGIMVSLSLGIFTKNISSLDRLRKHLSSMKDMTNSVVFQDKKGKINISDSIIRTHYLNNSPAKRFEVLSFDKKTLEIKFDDIAKGKITGDFNFQIDDNMKIKSLIFKR